MHIIPSGQTLGARIEGLDLAQPLSDQDRRAVLRALGQYGVLCFPRQTFGVAEFAAFGRRFGDLEINVANLFHEPNFPDVMILSNMKDGEGKPVGLHDAGQGWHTDMSYSKDIALANALHAKQVPQRNGKPLGGTQFRTMHAGYAMRIEGLEPAESAAMLEFLFRHQAQAKYLYSHDWKPGDLLMWDNIG